MSLVLAIRSSRRTGDGASCKPQRSPTKVAHRHDACSWKCGANKIGALSLCGQCGAAPASQLEKATSLLLSDHLRSGEELSAMAERIAGGKPVAFPDAELAHALSTLREVPRMPLGCAVAVWIPIVLLVLLAVLVIWLAFAGAYA